MNIKNSFLFAVLTVLLIIFEHGFLRAVGGGAARLMLMLDILIWLVFFFRLGEALEMALLAGLINESASPYYFGSAILAFFFALLGARFLTTKVFTNRSMYAFIITSLASIIIYFLTLGAGALISFLGKYKVFITPLEMTSEEIMSVAAVNIIFLLLLYFITNLVTKKMHSAFISK